MRLLLAAQQGLALGFDGLPLADVAERADRAVDVAILVSDMGERLFDRKRPSVLPRQLELTSQDARSVADGSGGELVVARNRLKPQHVVDVAAAGERVRPS